MRRFILTGMPGAGKTLILRQLEVQGQSVVEEAATDVIALMQSEGSAEPWTQTGFVDRIVGLQRQRQQRMAGIADDIQFFDRSPVCTQALSTYLDRPPSEALLAELARVEREAIYQTDVFFIGHLGLCTPTEARRISFEQALDFEQVHEQTYRASGYRLVRIAPGPVAVRAAQILDWVHAARAPADAVEATQRVKRGSTANSRALTLDGPAS